MKHRFAQCAAFVFALLSAVGAAHAQVVISQVYGGGGNSGATLKSDFIELRNNGTAAVSLAGWSVQYASATGSSWQRTNLSGSIAPGGYFLVKEADGSGGTVALTPDVAGTIAMSGTAGKVALANSQVTLAGACPLGGAVVDFVGFGSANCAETAPTATLSNTTAALRKGDGSIDTGNNGADFVTGTPNPRSSATAPPPPPEPALPLSIAQVQGSGLRSAYVDTKIVTEGIVTALKFNNGFFLQSASGDGNPATSEAIFVFTGAAPAVAVGSRVRVTAKVTEFTPSGNPHQLSITELVDPVVEVLGSSALPAAIELTAAELGPAATPATLEPLEGMRVSVAAARVVAGSDGSIDENDALSFTDGVFHVVLPGVARPFREAGMSVLEAAPIPAGKLLPRFDTNPERLMVRSRGQVGATPRAVDVDADVSGLVGVLDYFSATWALLPDPAAPIALSGGKQAQAVHDAAYEDVTIGGFNLLRFFDDVANGNGAVTLTAAALDKRLAKTAAAICGYLKTPDILGVVEVENLHVLELLSARIDANCAGAPHYVPYLQPGNDVGGINVGFLVATRDNGAGVARVEVLDVTQYGKAALLHNPNGSTDLLNDRPPLVLRARVHQDNGASYAVTVVVNHLRSLNDLDLFTPGADGWATSSERVRAKRGAQAMFLAELVNTLQQQDPGQRIVLVGDFNAFEFNDGYVDVMGIVRGAAAPEAQVLGYYASPLLTPLVDGADLIADPAERYSYVFAGNAQTLDHALVNEALVLDALTVRVEHARINADFGVHHFGEAGNALRVSDHDPVRIAIGVPGFRSADLAITASAAADSVHVGDNARFLVQVGNAGPNAADFASIGFVFDAAVSPLLGAPADWACTAPAQHLQTTTVTCTSTSLAKDASAAFSVEVPTVDALGGRALHMAVAAASSITDPANADNTAGASVAVNAEADLSVTLTGPTQPFRAGTVGRFPVVLHNAGADAAWQPSVSLHGDVPAAAVAIDAPAGWTCAVAAGGAGFEATCSLPGAFAAGGTQVFDFAITAPPRAGKDRVVLGAAADAATPDGQFDNDSAGLEVALIGAPRETPASIRQAPAPPGRAP